MNLPRLGSVEFDALAEALDQYCANQREHEECEGTPASPKLAAAERMLAQLNAQLAALAETAATKWRPF